ncbi:MAG: zf-HC2 domain-containing protein [Acidobacteriota bacterium]|nr:zf-HC2 domain-containing protein [Acidobacteriota bacterium]
MKQANNNEVDLLLRSLASRGVNESELPGPWTSGTENPALFAHLDADELNSYAEGVLSAPARARYTEHLADCARCRRIVLELTQTAGATRPYQVFDEHRKSGFWHKFSAFFSTPVLRYAVPALGLTAVIAISMVALRQQRRSELVAQNQPISSPASASEPSQTELRSITESPATRQGVIESKANADSTRLKKDLQADKSALDQAPRTSTGANLAKEAPARDSTKSGEAGSVVALSPYFAPEPPPPSGPQPMPSEADKIKTTSNEQTAEREDQARQREPMKDEPIDATAPQAASKTGAATLSTRHIQGLSVESTTESRSGGKDKKGSRNEVETRSVSGRHFRHQGNAWIDKGYKSSRGTINVARGSEQFRSLVADEPGIRAIAEQLGGEIIVVWKGRAYRIY